MTIRHNHEGCAHHAGHHASARREPLEVAPGTIWTCPMHPQIRRDAPGSCPICGMALEQREPTAEDQANPELTDMSRRLWVSLALTVPIALLVVAAELFGIEALPM